MQKDDIGGAFEFKPWMAPYITEIRLNRQEVYGISLRMTLEPLSFWMKDELGAQVRAWHICEKYCLMP